MAGAVGQAVFDLFCEDMDRSLREMGVGDLGGAEADAEDRRGLLRARGGLRAALAGGDADELAAALARNVFAATTGGGRRGARGICAAVDARACAQHADADLLAGRIAVSADPARLSGGGSVDERGSGPFPSGRRRRRSTAGAGIESRSRPAKRERAAIAEAYGLVEVRALAADVEAVAAAAAGLIASRGGFGRTSSRPASSASSRSPSRSTSRSRVRFVAAGSPSRRACAKPGAEVVLDAEADEPPEILAGSIDRSRRVVVEHFVLAIDPYPRAPGAALPPECRWTQGRCPADSPFAVLAKLAPGQWQGAEQSRIRRQGLCLAMRKPVWFASRRGAEARRRRYRGDGESAGSEWRRRSPHRLTSWAATRAPSSSFPAPTSRWSAVPDLRFRLFGDEKVVGPLLDALSAARGRVDLRALRRRRADGRQAEPGASPRPLALEHVARDRGGEEGRGRFRRFRRQHRRADGDGEVLPADQARRSTARRSPRCGRRCAAKASCSMSARRSAPTRSSFSTSP